MNYSDAARLRSLEDQRREALARQDAKGYRSLCDQMGLGESGIEDSDLYVRGIVSNIEAPLTRPNPSSTGEAILERYRKVVRGAEGLRVDDLSRDIGAKRSLLGVFPRFREDGTHSIRDMSDAQVGKLFKGVYRSALTYVRPNN